MTTSYVISGLEDIKKLLEPLCLSGTESAAETEYEKACEVLEEAQHRVHRLSMLDQPIEMLLRELVDSRIDKALNDISFVLSRQDDD